eukprot:scaffold6016_cov119-Isochrysis_galbana.AAC.15
MRKTQASTDTGISNLEPCVVGAFRTRLVPDGISSCAAPLLPRTLRGAHVLHLGWRQVSVCVSVEQGEHGLRSKSSFGGALKKKIALVISLGRAAGSHLALRTSTSLPALTAHCQPQPHGSFRRIFRFTPPAHALK